MEQTNLVVTPDGKSWDQVTRDTSYLSPSVALVIAMDGADANSTTTPMYMNVHRGDSSKKHKTDCIWKDIIWSHNRMIVLVDGYYEIIPCTHVGASGGGKNLYITINGNTTDRASQYFHSAYMTADVRNPYPYRLKRGDIVQISWDASPQYYVRSTNFRAIKIGD